LRNRVRHGESFPKSDCRTARAALPPFAEEPIAQSLADPAAPLPPA
jgi:hypothetical protein